MKLRRSISPAAARCRRLARRRRCWSSVWQDMRITLSARQARKWCRPVMDVRPHSSEHCVRSSTRLPWRVDIFAKLLDQVRLKGTVLFHYELGCPWSVALPGFPDTVFHYVGRGSAIVVPENGPSLRLAAGDLLLARGTPHVICSSRRARPIPLLTLDFRPAHLGDVRYGGKRKPISTMTCGNFIVARPAQRRPLHLMPPMLHLKPSADGRWLQSILQRLVFESAVARPGQQAVLSRMTEVLFVEVLRAWIKTLRPGEGGWLGAMTDPSIGKVLQLIHEQPRHPWTLRELASIAGLGRSGLSARFTRLVGQPVHRYLVMRRMEEAATMLEADDESIAQIAARAGYETTAAFSKVFHRYHGLSPGRYRARGMSVASHPSSQSEAAPRERRSDRHGGRPLP